MSEEVIDVVEDMAKKEPMQPTGEDEDFILHEHNEPYDEYYVEDDTHLELIEQSITETEDVIQGNMNGGVSEEINPTKEAAPMAENRIIDAQTHEAPIVRDKRATNQSLISEIDSNMFEFNLDNAYESTSDVEATNDNYHRSGSQSS